MQVLRSYVSDIFWSSFPQTLMQQQEMRKWMYNGNNTFWSKKQEVYYSSNTSVSEVLDKNRRTQNNKDLLLTNLYFNKTWRNTQSKILCTDTEETVPDFSGLVWSD